MLRSNPVYGIQFCSRQWRRERRDGEARHGCFMRVGAPNRSERGHRKYMLSNLASRHK